MLPVSEAPFTQIRHCINSLRLYYKYYDIGGYQTLYQDITPHQTVTNAKLAEEQKGLNQT